MSETTFLGGSLDGQKVDVPLGVYSWRVPKLGLAVNRFEELPSLSPKFDVETYLYDHVLGRFVEEGMASDDCIKWETHELKMTLVDYLGDEDSELFIIGKRHFTREFDARTAGETLKMGRKIGLKLNAIKFLLDKVVELKQENDYLSQALATQRAELLEQQKACAIDCDWKALNEASVEVFRAELAEGVRGKSGWKVIPGFGVEASDDGELLIRPAVLELIEGLVK